MRILVELDNLANSDSDSIVCALDAIANDLADRGYADAEFTVTPTQANGAKYRYCLSQKDPILMGRWKMNLIAAIQYVDAVESESEADEMLSFLRTQVDYLGGRILPAIGDIPLRVQAFFDDASDCGPLPDGCRRVLVPEHMLGCGDEDRLAEAAFERTRGQETVPAAVVDRLLAGDCPVTVWREHRGLTLRALADKAGLGPGYLWQIENGTRQGPIATMKKLAAALDTDLDDLI